MNTLSFHRIKHLFASYFIANWQKDLKTLLIVFAANVLLISLLNVDISFSLVIVFVMSILYAGRIFGVLGSNGAVNYLSLPANTSEKLIVNISLSHIYYPVILYLASILGSLLGVIIYDAAFGGVHLWGNVLFGNLNYNSIISLLVTISIFMFASVYSRKNAVSKLLVVFAVLFFVFILVFSTIGIQVILPMFDFSTSGVEWIYSADLFERFNLFFAILDYVIIAFFWVLSYFRLRETEA